jgi:hypothetical protein
MVFIAIVTMYFRSFHHPIFKPFYVISITCMETTTRTLTDRDIERLEKIQKSIAEGNACSYDKGMCLEYLDRILNPKCCICRKPLEGEIEIVKDHKMHKKCRNKYKG